MSLFIPVWPTIISEYLLFLIFQCLPLQSMCRVEVERSVHSLIFSFIKLIFYRLSITNWCWVKIKVAQLFLTLCLCDPIDYVSPWNSPGQNTGVSSLSLLQHIFPTQELNQGLLHCKWILYQLSYREAKNT